MEKIKKYHELEILFNKNDEYIQNEIITTINEKPSKSDCIGFVYCFYSTNDIQLRNNFWIKIGRTERNPFIRVEKEWKGQLIFCIKTSYNHKLEKLVHLFFDYSREPKINREQDIIKERIKESFFKKLLCCFKQKQEINIEYIPLKKEIEWFHFKENININSIISQIQQLVEETYDSKLLNYETEYKVEEESKININTSTLEELQQLPYIGKVLSNRIIEYRNNKKFESIEEIKKVDKRINNLYTKLENKICI